MDCSKRRASALGDLPVDPLVEILSRVPAESVCRFKCVSKAWCDLIADPEHRKKLPQAMEGLFCETSDKSSQANSFSFVDLIARSVPLGIDSSFSFLTELPGIQVLVLLGSCNGLILFEHNQDYSFRHPLGYIVCNPTTKEWQAVPPCVYPGPTQLTYTYLAFDPAVSSRFNFGPAPCGGVRGGAPCGVRGGVYFCARLLLQKLGPGVTTKLTNKERKGSWKDGVMSTFMFMLRVIMSPFVNGFLHLLVWDQDQMKILAVDVQGKARRMIPLPHVADGSWMCYFGESQGHLHYMTQEKVDAHYKLSIWVLQGYDRKEWVLKHTVDTHEVSKIDSCVDSTSDFVVVNIHQDCNVVFLHQDNGKLVAYDMSNKKVSVIATFDDQKWLSSTARYVPCFRKSPSLTNKH